MKNFMEVELKPKPLNAKALEEMAKKDKLTNYYKVAILAIKEKREYEP